MQKRCFVIRTIRDGQVKINNKTYRASNEWLKYDGRLDGLRYAFGLYWKSDGVDSFVTLWGSEESYHAAKDVQQWDRYVGIHSSTQPEAVYDEETKNWFYPWLFWLAEDMG